jgi:hypothetical protein
MLRSDFNRVLAAYDAELGLLVAKWKNASQLNDQSAEDEIQDQINVVISQWYRFEADAEKEGIQS